MSASRHPPAATSVSVADMEQTVHRGQCLCGAIRYLATGPPVIVAHCFCRNCQRQTGSTRSTGAMFRKEQVTLEGEVASYQLGADSGSTVTRTFCPTCGSQLYGQNTAMEGVITIAVGTFDDPTAFYASVAIFTRTKLPRDLVEDGVSCYEAQPQWSPNSSA